MNLTDLRIFVSAAQRPSLGAVAIEMHLTPSAVSKALRRLEHSLETPLFDRSARLLVLNESGRRLLPRARTLLALADQARGEVMGERAAVDCRLGGPALLLWRHGQAASVALDGLAGATLRLQAMFEDEALAALARGDIHGAIVSGEVIAGQGTHWAPEWEATPLGELHLQLMAGRAHPLAQGRKRSVRVTSARLKEHDFACPPRSLLCGMQRAERSDGWRDDQLPRRIRYWTDDLQLLLGFVRAGRALAYLPDFAQAAEDLVRIEVSDYAFACSEQVFLVWHPAQAGRWMAGLAHALVRGLQR